MKTQLKKLSAAGALSLGLALSAQAATIDLTGVSYVTYGDGNSYSLPISAYINNQINGGGVGPGSPFYVHSSVGHIQNLIVVATGAGGVPVNNNFPGMDNAYPTPNSSGIPFFSTGITTDPGTGQPVNNALPGFTGDGANTWDTTLGALQTFLGSDSLVFFFNNNQINSGAATNQNLAAWAQITLSGPSGLLGTWDFTNTNSPYALVTQGGGGVFNGNPTAYTSSGAGPIAGTNAATDYVLSGGAICVHTTTFVPVPCGSAGASGPINHNLGADQAAYAIVFPELNAALNTLFALSSLTGYAMSIDLRMGCDPNTAAGSCTGRSLNNGYEQLFIGTAAGPRRPPVQVPEPATIALMGLGLLGVVWLRGRRTAK